MRLHVHVIADEGDLADLVFTTRRCFKGGEEEEEEEELLVEEELGPELLESLERLRESV